MVYNFIDADGIIFIVGSRYDNPRTYKMVKRSVLKRVDSMIQSIIKASGCEEYMGFFGSSIHKKNFRYDVAITKPYKGNRGEVAPNIAHWSPIIKEHMQTKWGFIPLDTIEADDAVIICAHHFGKPTKSGMLSNIVISSPDKDLKQCPCKIYDFRKHEMTYVNKKEGAYSLHSQLIKGDSTDNILALPGAGPKKAAEILKACVTPLDMSKAVFKAYVEYFQVTLPEKAKKTFIKTRLDEYKADKGITRWTKKLKDPIMVEILEEWDKSDKGTIKTVPEIKTYMREQIALIKMLQKPAYGFTIPELRKVEKTDEEIKVTKMELEDKTEMELLKDL